MPIVTVELLEGRTIEQKKQLAGEVIKALINMGRGEKLYTSSLETCPSTTLPLGGELASEKKGSS